MEKKVIINVTSLQRNEAGKDEKITLETPGIYGEKDGMKYVSYEETKLAGMEGTTTTLEIHKELEAAIANYLGGTDEFDQAIAAFAQAYAEQNEEDYSLFRKLIKKGELPCSKKSGAKK